MNIMCVSATELSLPKAKVSRVRPWTRGEKPVRHRRETSPTHGSPNLDSSLSLARFFGENNTVSTHSTTADKSSEWEMNCYPFFFYFDFFVLLEDKYGVSSPGFRHPSRGCNNKWVPGVGKGNTKKMRKASKDAISSSLHFCSNPCQFALSWFLWRR